MRRIERLSLLAAAMLGATGMAVAADLTAADDEGFVEQAALGEILERIPELDFETHARAPPPDSYAARDVVPHGAHYNHEEISKSIKHVQIAVRHLKFLTSQLDRVQTIQSSFIPVCITASRS